MIPGNWLTSNNTLSGHFIKYTCSNCLFPQTTNELITRNEAATECACANKLLVGVSTQGKEAKAAPACGNNDDGRNQQNGGNGMTRKHSCFQQRTFNLTLQGTGISHQPLHRPIRMVCKASSRLTNTSADRALLFPHCMPCNPHSSQYFML